MKLLHVVGARPNFMKVAPILRVAGQRGGFEQVLVHTGQHFDDCMSDVFFRELALPRPDEYLGVSGGSHAEQTARIMLAFEPILLKHRPDWLIVVGDVNSTLACSLVASKLGVPIAHVESGLRSGDMSMPEEVNRRVTDSLAQLLFTPSPDAQRNLLAEGVPLERIRFVGNVMIDSLVRVMPLCDSSDILERLALRPREYIVATLHRPSNVDDVAGLRSLFCGLETLSRTISVVFPVHPRTRRRLLDAGVLSEVARDLRLTEPLGYVDFLTLVRGSRAVITDSGGVQEETTFLGVPCLTVRRNTERPITIEEGTNQLVEPATEPLLAAVRNLDGRRAPAKPPTFWDGHAAERILDALEHVR